MRHQIFFVALERCKKYSEHWQQQHIRHQIWKPLDASIAQDVQIGLLSFSWVNHAAVRHTRILQSCRSCELHSLTDKSYTIAAEVVNAVDHDDSASLSSSDEGAIANLINARQEQGGPSISASPGTAFSNMEAQEFDFDFDDYSSAPLQDAPQEELIGTYTFTCGGVPLVPAAWSQWRDYGWRLPHCLFYRTIQSLDATRDLDAALSFAAPNAQHSGSWPYPPSDGGHLQLSASQLLDEAGQHDGSMESRRVIVTGCERSGGKGAKRIILNLEKDQRKLDLLDVGVSVDIDSLIWVTSAINFRVQSLNIYLSPPLDTKAAFSVNNFVYVNVMEAPINEDQLQFPAGRSQKNLALSRIPHIPLGFCGHGERRINFYVFFPRMIHRRKGSSRYATFMPQVVKDLWYDKVIISACNDVFGVIPGYSEYLPSSLQHVRNLSDYKPKSFLVNSPEKVVTQIHALIQQDADLLACFGSFFIVADGRGMKIATKQCIPPDSQENQPPTFDLIKAQFPDLNWERMLDRTYGELFLDVGISYHAQSSVPLTGLWRLPHLKASFNHLGSKAPTVHHFGTLAHYGGLKSEMKASCKIETHVVSRLSYCLAFETVRAPGTDEYLCSDKDIIERSARFKSACSKWMNLFASAESRPYGVRDEIRGLGTAILRFLPKAVDKVIFSSSTYHSRT